MGNNQAEDPDFTDDDLDMIDEVLDRIGADTVRTLKPAKTDKEGRLNLDAPATRTFVKGMIRHLAERFGITYKDKPDA